MKPSDIEIYYSHMHFKEKEQQELLDSCYSDYGEKIEEIFMPVHNFFIEKEHELIDAEYLANQSYF
ncbi:hypothetical protein LRP52_29265 [Photobacterium sp. ZSDE20]|uniref:Uncharacterized protein n=1 Tax=Photobacterium pectinilyticum TaxID=2906793 RepID=A0ABT1N6B0_9GAMM|nr:hypothetical protein [Photobacterium sp. ZSDE20]MCQ1060283.1 hypothetical protein [Photobacterium sp. ZSDE20]MDD1826270.1 hypothetical protein [Photobacterium sp. ZSDE20]